MPSKHTSEALRTAAINAEIGVSLNSEATTLARMFKTYKQIYSRPEDKPYLRSAVTNEMAYIESKAFVERIVNPVIKRYSRSGPEHVEYNSQVRRRVLDSVVRYGSTFFLHAKVNYIELAKKIEDGKFSTATVDRLYGLLNALKQRNAAPYEGSLDYEVLNTRTNGFDAFARQFGYALAHADGRTSRMQIVAASSAFQCECCGEPYKSSHIHEGWLSPERASRVCTTCITANDSIFAQCGMTGRYWKIDENNPEMASITIGGVRMWRHVSIQQGLIREHEGRWVTIRRLASHQSTLGGYHGVRRQWDHVPITEIPVGAIGVELEIGFKDGEEARDRFLRKELASTGRFADFPMLIESDSSLSGIPGGCEIIGPPLAFQEGYADDDSIWKRFLKLLNENGAQGWKHREKAGIHVNLDARDMDQAHRLKFVAFINNAAALSKFISGRKNLYQCFGARDAKQMRADTMYQGGYIEMRRDVIGDGSSDDLRDALYRFTSRKYSPVYIRASRPDVMEVRIFGSNIKYEGFMATVEYCVAVKEFVETKTLLEIFSSTLSAEFRAWLGTKTDVYKNLCLRLGVVARELGKAVPSDKKVAAQLEAA